MRNPDRIAQLTEEITAVWSRVPDQRFMQLLYNMGFENTDLQYNMEDDEALRRVRHYAKDLDTLGK